MRRTAPRNGILLVHPPYTDSRGPYVAIPQLAAFLKSRGIPVVAADLGAGFLKRFLTASAIVRGAAHVKDRFRLLNGQQKLTFPEQVEYNILIRILRELPIHAGDINWISTPFAGFSDIQEADARAYLMLLTSMPYFPEIFLADHHSINPARFYPFSSRELLAAARDTTPYTDLFRAELEAIWPSSPLKIVGFSVVFTHQIVPAFQIAAMIRRMDPGVHITMGGPCISIFFRDLKNPDLFDLVDSLVLDDGEVPLEQLYRAKGQDSSPLENIPIEKIPGVICRKEGQVSHTPPVPPLELEELPEPDLTLFDLESYLVPREKIMFPIRISRGCTWQQCTFCRTDHPLCRAGQEPGADYLFEIIRNVYKEQGIRKFFFSTESASPVLLEDLSRHILRENMSVQWITHTRISRQLTQERCRLFTNAGCSTLAVGIESMSDRILRLMRKGITTGLIRRVLEEVNGRLNLIAYMMVGFPSETREEALASYSAVDNFKQKGWLADFSYSMFVLQQGSAIFKSPADYGITEVVQDPDEDLNPDVADFSGSGMSRESAFELYLSFVKKQIYKGRNPEDQTHVPVDREFIPLAHDLDSLRRAARAQWRSLVVPFGKWMIQEGAVMP